MIIGLFYTLAQRNISDKKILESSENLNNMRDSDASQCIVNLNAYLSECVFPTLYTTPGNREKVMNPDESYMNSLSPASLGIIDKEMDNIGFEFSTQSANGTSHMCQ